MSSKARTSFTPLRQAAMFARFRTGPSVHGTCHDLAPTWLDLARLGSTWLDLARLGSTWLDLARLGSTWLDLARLGSTWLDLARLGSTWPDLARLGPDLARPLHEKVWRSRRYHAWRFEIAGAPDSRHRGSILLQPAGGGYQVAKRPDNPYKLWVRKNSLPPMDARHYLPQAFGTAANERRHPIR
jgi:hypothetical protein